MTYCFNRFNSTFRQSLLTVWLAWLRHAQVAAQNLTAFVVPDDTKIPIGVTGDAIKLGRAIALNTPLYAPLYSGNALSCTHCHVDAGRKQFAAPWVGVVGVYPQFRARNDKVNSLPERINDCFERSLNGHSLPLTSKEMQALMAYLTWLSQDVPVGVKVVGNGLSKINPTLRPNAANGPHVFNQYCVQCHGAQGQGLIAVNGEVVFPPLWGNKSFNLGAGMARYNTAAAFIKTNMPKGNEGILSEQEALDVAYFITRQTRPDFAAKQFDWPAGHKPSDTPY